MKTILITGGSSGIGRVTAKTLALQGNHVFIVARCADKGQRLIEEIKAEQPDAKAEFFAVDLSVEQDVKAFAQDIRERTNSLDVLILNAGLLDTKLRKAPSGHERMFATTHLGHFLLTHELMPLLEQSESARIVVTSSVAHFWGSAKGMFSDLKSPSKSIFLGVQPALAYGRSKLANILFVRELSERVKDKGVLVNAFHPGGVKTDIWRSTPKSLMKLINPFLITQERGADTQMFLAINDKVKDTGKYWAKRKQKYSSLKSRSKHLARKLWQYSEQELGIREFGKPSSE